MREYFWVVERSDAAQDVADVGQRHACVVEVHRPAVAQHVRAQLGVGEGRVGSAGLVFAQIQAIPPRVVSLGVR